jgi:hypothetical protein
MSRAHEVIIDNFVSPFIDLYGGSREVTADLEKVSVKYVTYCSFIRSNGPNRDRGSELYRTMYQTPNTTDIVYLLARHTNTALRYIYTS